MMAKGVCLAQQEVKHEDHGDGGDETKPEVGRNVVKELIEDAGVRRCPHRDEAP